MSCRKGNSGEHIFMCYPVYMSLYRLLCHAERETVVNTSSCVIMFICHCYRLLCHAERETVVNTSSCVILFICHCIGCYVMQKGRQW